MTDPVRPDDIAQNTWDSLTDMEREAMAEEGAPQFETDGPGLHALPDLPPLEEPVVEKPAAETPPEGEKPDAAAAPAAPAAAPADAVAAEEDPTPAAPAAAPAPGLMAWDENAPQIEPPPPIVIERVAERSKELTDALAAIDKRHDEGEIDTVTMIRERDAVRDKQTELRMEVQRAEIRESERNNVITARWDVVRNTFFAQPDNNAYYAAGSPQMQELHDTVKEIANRVSSRTWTDVKLLAEADRRVRAIYGAPRAATKAAPAPAAATPPAAPAPSPTRKAALPNTPTLSAMPAADIETGESKFANLDRLKGADLEKAVASMTAEQRADYLAGN